MPEVIHRDDNRKGTNQSESEERPGGDEFANDRLPGSDGHGEKQFHRAHAALFRPETHSYGRDEEQVKPGMPQEKRGEIRLVSLEETAGHKGKKASQQEK